MNYILTTQCCTQSGFFPNLMGFHERQRAKKNVHLNSYFSIISISESGDLGLFFFFLSNMFQGLKILRNPYSFQLRGIGYFKATGENVLMKWLTILKNSLPVKKFALQMDETQPCWWLLLVMVLLIINSINSFKFREEMLFIKKLKTDPKGEAIFEVVKSYFNKSLSKTLWACGAISMTGRYRRFIFERCCVISVLCSLHGSLATVWIKKKLAGRLWSLWVL